MTNDEQDEFDKRIKSLDIIIKLGWGILAASFALGVWVANIQMAVNNNTYSGQDREVRIRVLEMNVATNSERISTSLRILEKLDRKLNP